MSSILFRITVWNHPLSALLLLLTSFGGKRCHKAPSPLLNLLCLLFSLSELSFLSQQRRFGTA